MAQNLSSVFEWKKTTSGKGSRWFFCLKKKERKYNLCSQKIEEKGKHHFHPKTHCLFSISSKASNFINFISNLSGFSRLDTI